MTTTAHQSTAAADAWIYGGNLLPPGWLGSHQQITANLAAVPVTASTIPELVEVFGGGVALLSRDLWGAQILRSSALSADLADN